MNTWNKDIFDEKVGSLRQGLLKNKYSKLEIDGLILRINRTLDYLVSCIDESDDLKEIEYFLFNVYDLYETYINNPDLIDEKKIVSDIKENLLPMFDMFSSTMENLLIEEDLSMEETNEFLESLNEKDRKRFLSILEMIANFALEYLNESYFELACDIAEKLHLKKNSNFDKGQARTWAAGIVYALCKANGILGNTHGHILSPGQIYDFFNVSSSSALSKSKIVMNLLDIFEGSSSWQAEKIFTLDFDLDFDDNKIHFDDLNLDYDEVKFDSSNWTLSKLSHDELESYYKAENILWEALDTNDNREIIRASKEALSISKYLGDAYYYLACLDAKTVDKAKAYVDKAIKMIESVWDKKVMKDTIGHFYLDSYTRPYMRLLSLKYELLEDEGKIDEAIKLAYHMLELCENDNLGIRYKLIILLLKINDYKAIDKLSHEYENDICLGWNYNIALRYFKDNQLDKARDALKKGFEINRYIVAYLLGSKFIDTSLLDMYAIGSEDEAMLYAANARDLWLETEGALEWLKNNAH